MHRRRVAGVIAVSALIGAPVALSVEAAPLPKRDGVVVAWRSASSTAVVVIPGTRRVYSVHSLRRVAPGSRVRVNGIKWGSPAFGIKWTAPPRGIKWGVRKARNGTYQSRLTRLGRTTRTSIRGTVVRSYGRRAVAVSVRGGTFLLPIARGAVWLPDGKRLNEAVPVGQPGSKVTIQLTFNRRGRPLARRLQQTARPVANGRIPIAGQVVARDMSARTLTIQANGGAFPLRLVVTVPVSFDLARYLIGSEVAGQFVKAPVEPGVPELLYATELSLNRTFGQADSPVTSLAVPPPNPAHLAAIDDLQARWITGRNAGLIPNTGLYTSQSNRLDRVEFRIAVSDKDKAARELEQFEKLVEKANEQHIQTALRDELVAAAKALREQVAAP